MFLITACISALLTYGHGANTFPGCDTTSSHGPFTRHECADLCHTIIDETAYPQVVGKSEVCGFGSDSGKLSSCFLKVSKKGGCYFEDACTSQDDLTEFPGCKNAYSVGTGSDAQCQEFCSEIVVNEGVSPAKGVWGSCGLGSTSPVVLKSCLESEFEFYGCKLDIGCRPVIALSKMTAAASINQSSAGSTDCLDGDIFPGCKYATSSGSASDRECAGFCRQLINDSVSPPIGLWSACGAGATDGKRLADCYINSYKFYGCGFGAPCNQLEDCMSKSGFPGCRNAYSVGPASDRECQQFCGQIINDSNVPAVGLWGTCGLDSEDPKVLKDCFENEFEFYGCKLDVECDAPVTFPSESVSTPTPTQKPTTEQAPSIPDEVQSTLAPQVTSKPSVTPNVSARDLCCHFLCVASAASGS